MKTLSVWVLTGIALLVAQPALAVSATAMINMSSPAINVTDLNTSDAIDSALSLSNQSSGVGTWVWIGGQPCSLCDGHSASDWPRRAI